METPKSVEATKLIAFEFYQRCGQHKGTPAERKMQEKVMNTVEADEEWTKSDDPKGKQGFIFPEAAPEPTKKNEPPCEHCGCVPEVITKEEGEAIKAWGLRQQAWLAEPCFLPLDKKPRGFLWKTFYVPFFEKEITLQDQAHIERIAKVLGKTGALTDMREDVEEWTDADDTETEEPQDD